jgi:DNA repair protein RadD
MTTISKSLYPFQEKAASSAAVSLGRGNAVVLVLPTGSGKTLIAARIATGFARVLFVAHRREILEKAKEDMPANVKCLGIAAALRIDPNDVDLLIIDECHRSGAPTYRALTERFGQASRLGLTATPLRMDGKGLCDTFDVIIEGPSTKQLIVSGPLVPFVTIEPPNEALKKLGAVRTERGDYVTRDLALIMNRPRLVGNVVREYLKWAKGRRAIIFAVNIKHSKALESKFISAGVKAKHIDGRAAESVRRNAAKDLAEG